MNDLKTAVGGDLNRIKEEFKRIESKLIHS
jgi:hypothetical protein